MQRNRFTYIAVKLGEVKAAFSVASLSFERDLPGFHTMPDFQAFEFKATQLQKVIVKIAARNLTRTEDRLGA